MRFFNERLRDKQLIIRYRALKKVQSKRPFRVKTRCYPLFWVKSKRFKHSFKWKCSDGIGKLHIGMRRLRRYNNAKL